MPGPLIVSVSGTQLSEKERQLLSHKAVGGIVLFRENFDKTVSTPEQAVLALKKLIAEIRNCNPDIIIMVDHEGGNIWRFTKANPAIRDFSQLATQNVKVDGFTKLVAAKIIGAQYDKDKMNEDKSNQNKEEALKMAFDNGKIMASELMDCGVDMSLAPVVDLDGDSNVIGKLFRAFHHDPKVVTELAEQFIRGMNAAGMPATLKHFPGHGSCVLDSHVAKPVDSRTRKELDNDLLPFSELIKMPDLNFAIMTAHVTYPAVDKDYTAGCSKKWIQGILREELQYQGVVMSDCLSMEGAAFGATLLDRIKAAAMAGNDFQMIAKQYNSPEDNKLDRLLALLDPLLADSDNKDSSERRAKFAATKKSVC